MADLQLRGTLLNDRMICERHRSFLCAPIACTMLAGMMAAQTPAPAPQQPQQENGTLTLHVTSRLVVLDVVVLDRQGHPVTNLDRSQFTITENKVEQKIRSFDPPSGHRMPAVSAGHPIVHGTADLAKIGNAPVNILVFDELNTQWEGTTYAREEMERYLKSQPEVLPVPTLLLAAGDSRFKVLHDYTQSRAELLDAIKKFWPEYPWQMMRGGSGNKNIELLEQTLGTLSQIAESSRGTPGRKNVIWVGTGYPTINTTTLEFDDEEKLQAAIQRVVDRMLDARVTLYMIDPRGVQTTVSGQGTAASDDGGAVDSGITAVVPYTGPIDFPSFAPRTGGEIFANRNDVNVAIEQSVQDGGEYYTLTYVPTAEFVPTAAEDDPMQYRHIKVSVKDKSLRVIARDGYFPGDKSVAPVPTGTEKPANELQFDMVSAAGVKLTYNGLKVQARQANGGYQLLVGTKELHWTDQPDGSRIAELTVMTTFFGNKDKELKSATAEVKEKIGTMVNVNGGGLVVVRPQFQPPIMWSRVRFVVRDAATGVIGTADAQR